ncbi:protein mono-ADP-ribosyltransferase PARP14-like isoform X2 [Mytilus californianus]|uniref:protein mono-ADP-ribosyltransferase PARP14-like isoform X2 n=1 Tax=Mytilus californianus TaxID=6549 RepID=UPI002245E83E|nr:protein mono-ADP-ribosyltransferase PARP14-like isoform X2 [Mytilus californianus]
MLTEIMSSESDEEEYKEARSGSSGSDENDGTPDQWSVPSMSQSMLNRFSKFPDHSTKSKQDNNSKVETGFVSSLSRVHRKEENIPPPVPPKTFKQKRNSFENPMETEEKSNSEGEDQNQPLFMNETTEGGNSNEKKMSVKDRARMFDHPQESDTSQSVEQSPGPNPFVALKRPAEYSPDIEEQNSSTKRPDIVRETNVDTGQVETTSDIEESMQEAEMQSQSHGEGADLSSNESSNLPTDSEPVSTGMPNPEQGRSSPWQHQGHPEPDRSSPWQNQGHPEPDRSSPWLQQHHPNAQYPGPRSAHGWPGTPPPPHGQLRYGHPHQNPGTPPSSGQVRYGHPHQYQDTPRMRYGQPRQHAPPYGAPPHQIGLQQQGYPPNQMQYLPQEGHGGPGGSPYFDPNYQHGPPQPIPGHYKGHGQHQSTPYQPSGPNKKHQPPHTSPRGNEHTPPKSKIPSRQVPTGKGETPKPGTRPSTETTSSKSDTKSGGAKPKLNLGKGAQRNEEPKVETKGPGSSKKAPEKMYLCVSGIDKEQTNETFFNFIEAKSKGDVNSDQSLRTMDEPEHAVVVFEDRIDVAKLKVACAKKALGNSSLEFEEIDPPRYIIASSVDKLTQSDFKDYLTKKKKQIIVKVHTTEEGPITAKFKEPSGVTEILKDTNVKISGSKVVISVMYFCDHGTYWDQSLHRVAIPGPFKPSVSDSHIRSFIIDITSVCNEHLEQHHACLTFKDELHIECTIDPKDKMARQKVKDWKNNVQKAWEEFVNNSAKKRELQITGDTKDPLLEHINKTKDQHKSEELKVISPDETGSMKFVFVGRSKIVENYVEQISAKKLEIEADLNRKKKIKTDSMKLKPIEIALMTKEDKFEEVKNIAPDFSCEPNTESGTITFTGVEEDISKAKVKIFEVKNNYHSWRIDSLSDHMCQLLRRKQVSDIVNESFSDDNISIVWDITDDHVTVCTSQDNRPHIEKVFKDTILEDEIKLDEASKDVLMLDEWAEKKTSINNYHRDTANIDDTSDDRIIVTATTDVFDGIMKELEIFITENSIKEGEITIREEEKFKFFKNHCKDWVKELEVKYSDQKLEIHFDRQSVKISGTPKVIDTVGDEIKNHLRKINKDIHVISEPGVDSLVSDQTKSDALVSPVEEETKTVITVDPNSVNKQAFRRNAGNKKTDDEYAWEQASKNYKKRGNKFGKGDKPQNAGPVVCKNGTKVLLVKKEDLGRQKADVIICSTNGQLDLSGPAGKSMVNAAGPEILVEIKQKYSDGIEHGEIAVVSGYKMNCKEVYLAALPGWSHGGEKIIAKCVNTCLLQASKYKSIVFPALGTGNLRYPRDLIAETMYKCVSQFDQSNTSLKEVKFLCYDDETIRAFEQEELRQVNPGFQPHRAAASGLASGPKYYKKHNTSVKVVKGDLGTQKVDVLICAVPKELNLESAGGAGKSLMQGLGIAVQQDILSQHPSGVTNGGFAAVKLSSPPGQCKSVYLTSLEPWDNQKKVPKDEDKQICKFVYQCLETAEKSGYKSIGIPAMGTGTIGYPHHLVAKYMYDMVEKFVTKHKSSKLTDVKLIVHSKDNKSITAFYDEEKKRLPAPAHVPVQAGHHKFASGDSSGSTQVVPKVVSDSEFQVGSVKLTVEQGDILSKKCDAIVNGTNHDFDLTKGAVSQALRKKCDAKKLDIEVSKKKDEMKQYGYARTSGCGLPCEHIIHISSQHKPHEWKKIIKKALAKADKKQIKTMAFPALGTGESDTQGAASTSEETMGQIIMEALVEFVSEGQKNLQHVFLVIFQDKMVKPMLKGVRSGGQTASTAKPGQVIKADNKRSWSVTFAIYGISQKDIDNAKEVLKSAVKEKFQTEKIPDRLISEINEHEIAYLKSIESNLPVQMTIDQVNSTVTLYGILDDVMNAKQEVFDALRKFAHTRHCKAEAAIIKEQVQWYFKDLSDKGLPVLTPYPDEINMYLETGYKGESGRKEVEFKDDQGEEYVIVLKDMMEYVKNDRSNKVEVLRREKIQGDGGTFEPPVNWDDQGSENVKLVTLLPTSAEYTTLEQKFIQSVFSGRPEWANQFNKQTLKVTKIERIQNLSLYHMYAAKKALIEKQNPQGHKNEQELWHGTPDKAILSINMYGFNRSYCSDNSKDAYWGDGVYFSADASYSARNWLATGTGTGDHNIYLCNVLTGVSVKGKKGMRVLPVRQDGTMLNYDSATDAKYNPVVEYVIFNDTQAYPQYCIKFKY